MAVIYLTSTDPLTLQAMTMKLDGNQLVAAYPTNLFGAAVPTQTATGPDGGTTTIPAKGVVGHYYLSVNDPAITLDAQGNPVWPGALPSGVSVDQANGVAVLGVWA